jgi:hypothetical protein
MGYPDLSIGCVRGLDSDPEMQKWSISMHQVSLHRTNTPCTAAWFSTVRKNTSIVLLHLVSSCVRDSLKPSHSPLRLVNCRCSSNAVDPVMLTAMRVCRVQYGW